MDTPYQWTKQVASHWGGTRNGTIVHWPRGIKAKGEIRSQFHHVIDVAPDGARGGGASAADDRARRAAEADRRRQHGVLVRRRADAAERHETQYFEMFGNRGIYHKGWTAVTKHRTPWAPTTQKMPAFDDDCWELYDTTKDWTQSKDLAKEQPDKLHELQRLWLIEATKYNVLPLDDRLIERAQPDTAGRPQLVQGDRQLLFGGMGRLTESSHPQSAQQVVRDHGGHHRSRRQARRRDHRARRNHRRLEPLRQGAASSSTATTSSG